MIWVTIQCVIQKSDTKEKQIDYWVFILMSSSQSDEGIERERNGQTETKK